MLFIVCYILSLFVQVVVIGLLSRVLKQIDSISILFSLLIPSCMCCLDSSDMHVCLFVVLSFV